jgi:hypothetical protein
VEAEDVAVQVRHILQITCKNILFIVVTVRAVRSGIMITIGARLIVFREFLIDILIIML